MTTLKNASILANEEIKKIIPILVMDTNLSGKYLVLEVPAPINNEVLLYEPIYGVNKIIKVKL